jgi:hypothetical protein
MMPCDRVTCLQKLSRVKKIHVSKPAVFPKKTWVFIHQFVGGFTKKVDEIK